MIHNDGVRKDRIGKEIIKSINTRITESQGQISTSERRIKELKVDIGMLKKYKKKLES